MKPYQNLNGDSIIQSFQIYGDAVKIKFNDGSVVLYHYEKAGRETVEKMKILALDGKGLGNYLNHSIKDLGETLNES